MKLIFEPLRSTMERAAFACGEPALDAYLHRQARQDMDRAFATVIAACADTDPDKIVGYYTLNAASIPLTDIPEDARKKMPRYSSVPAVCLGRLAMSREHQGKRMGTLLLIDALARSCRTELAWAVFFVDAKHDRAGDFYQKMMFQPFQDRPNSFWMHRKQAEAIVAKLRR